MKYLEKYHVYRSYDLHDYNIATGRITIDHVVPIECGVINGSVGLDEVKEWRQMSLDTSIFKSRAGQKPLIQSIIPYAPIHQPLGLSSYLNQLETIAAPLKVVGVRRLIQIEADRRAACTSSFRKGLEILQKTKPNWFFDAGIRADQLPCMIELVASYPHLLFVIDHHAKPEILNPEMDQDWRKNIEKLAKLPNVVMKVSGLVNQVQNGQQPFDSYTKEQIEPYVRHVIESFGYDRVMFASNWFVISTFSTWQSWFEMVLEICDELQATEEEKDALFRKTAMRVHHLS